MRIRSQIRLHKRTILLITTTAIIAVVLSAAIAVLLERFTSLRVPTIGTIRTSGVEVYWDKELTNRTESLNWGTIRLGESQSISLHIRSISNIETTLNLTMENLTLSDSNENIVAEPENMASYMNLTWNYNQTKISPGETLQLTLTLSVGHSVDFTEFLIANGVEKFSFDIYISTSQPS